jgi:hypothetical protein
MGKSRCAVAVLFVMSALPLFLAAQENAKPDNKKPGTTLKVQVTLSEMEGEKKVANLPYTFFLKAQEPASGAPPWTKVRIGSRIPVYVGKEGGMQYIDVGTNVDARGFILEDGRFEIYLDLERSWVEGDVLVPTEKPFNSPTDPNAGHFKEPIIRQFRNEQTFTMSDGQTMQSTQAADPLSGRVITATVTINVVK